MSTSPRVRLYGYGRGEASFTQVTRGMRRALESIGELAGFWPVDLEEGSDDVGGVGAPLSLNIGNPRAMLQAHRYGSHRAHWLLLAPNSEGLPMGFPESLLAPSKILELGMLTGGLLAPSAWAAGVLRRSFPETVRILVCPHGVTPEIHQPHPVVRERIHEEYRKGYFRVLHLSSTELERKGTKLLLQAWAELKESKSLPEKAVLFIVMNPLQLSRAKWWCEELGLGEEDVTVAAGLTSNQESMAIMYRAMHLVCQPSRAEGFGLVPLEALCCGVPVVATQCTGHTEWAGGLAQWENLPAGLMPVVDWDPTPIDDYPGAVAPTVNAREIGIALKYAYRGWEEVATAAEQAASELGQKWAWDNVSAPALREMVKEPLT